MKIKLLVASVALATAQVQAGGFENARLDTSFMYDEGNLVSFGSVRKDFTVNGSSFGTTGSLIGDRNASNLSAKYQVNEHLSLGLSAYDSGAIHINYQGAGISPAATAALTAFGSLPSSDPRSALAPLVNVNAAGPKVNLSSDSIAMLANYKFSENFSGLIGGRYDKYSVADADIFQLSGGSSIAQVSSDSDLVPVMGVAYQRPKIALRMELLYQGRSEVAMPTTCAYSSPFSCATDVSTGGLAEFMTLNFQTGIMEDTLLLASVHKGKWSKSQLSVADTELANLGQDGPTSAFKDSTEYSLGIARRINDSLAVSASYNWEKAGNGATSSLFTVNDGYKGITLGVRYTVKDVELSVGYNRTKLGKVTYNGLNELSGNTVTAIGAKATLRF